MIELLRTRTLSQAYGLQTALKAAGIDCLLQGEHTIAITGGGVSVQVNDADVEQAKAVLQEFL